MFDSPPWCMDSTNLDAEVIRRAVGTLLNPAGGVVSSGDLALTQNGTPNMSVNVGTGQIWVPGTTTATQGPYYSQNKAAVNLAITASNPSNPRVDTIIAQVQDAAYAGASRQFGPTVLTGTPTAGASLTNLDGLATVPASSLVIGYVLVPANATSITNADILYTAAALNNNFTTMSVSGTAASNQTVLSAGAITVTLPPNPAQGDFVAIFSGGGGETTVSAGSHVIYGVGAQNVPSVPLGSVNCAARFVWDGGSWIITSGQQDSGWVGLTAGTNVSPNGSYYAPAARLQGDTVKLRGVYTSSATLATGVTIATVPASCRPTSNAPFPIGLTTPAASSSQNVTGYVTPSGLVVATGVGLGWNSGTNFFLEGSYELS